jgi:hypothetical protein
MYLISQSFVAIRDILFAKDDAQGTAWCRVHGHYAVPCACVIVPPGA